MVTSFAAGGSPAPARRTLGDRIRVTGGYTSGFDYLRLVLAVLVLLGHSFLVSGDGKANQLFGSTMNAVRGYGVLPMFFSLSGFLVAASLIRTPSLKVFLGLRVLRIFPALCVEIALSALLLGPLLTSFDLSNYFSGSEFWLYFANMIGWIHYQLPGVFLGHPISGIVNGSLWTVPYEAECYIVLAILAVLGIARFPRLFLAGLIFITIALLAWALTHADPEPWRSTATGRQLVLFFLSGVLLYLLRDHVPWSGWLALASTVASALLLPSHTLIYLAPLPVAYVTAYLGLLRPKKLPILFTGDYSYGIYLYAYPMQQAAVQLLPAGSTWWGNFLCALTAVSLFAAFSWHAVEKPMLRLKRLLLTRAKPALKADEMISPDKGRRDVAEGGGEAIPPAEVRAEMSIVPKPLEG